MINKYKSLLSLIVICTALTIIFFGKILINVNNYYFVDVGDGIQTYHELLYHVKHDSSYFESRSMQYPYGDNAFFSVNPLMLTNAIKLIDVVIPIQNYSIAIFNCFVIFSILLGAIALYYLFKAIKVDSNYSALFAILISFMSPQIIRFGGHNSLGYVFAIPLFTLFIINSWNKPNIFKSFLISIYVFFISGNHLYYFGFFLLIAVLYYSLQYILYYKDQKHSIIKRLLHLFIQVLLPFIIIQLLINSYHPVSDRSPFPWNFFFFTGSISGIYFPEFSFYKKLFETIIEPSKIIYEARSYIGLLAVIISVLLLAYTIKYLIDRNFKKIIYFNENHNVVILLYISLAGLFVGLGLPFVTNWGRPLFDYIGYIKQFRAIARFNWVFYYCFNIVAFYLFYIYVIKQKPTLKYFLLSLVCIIYALDIYAANKDYNERYDNRITELEDINNKSEYNSWLSKININDYQAIIGVPYFSQGSENLYMGDGFHMRDVMLYSVITGLPSFDLHSNRTSRSETYKTTQFLLEPYRENNLIQNFKSNKDFLILRTKGVPIKEFESRLMVNAILFDSTPNLYIYRLPFEYFNKSRSIYLKDFKSIRDYTSIDSNRYIYLNYDSYDNKPSYFGNGSLAHPCQHYLTIYEGKVPEINNEELNISFWFGNINDDVILRGVYLLELFDQYGRKYFHKEMNMGKSVSIIDGDWALIEDNVMVNNSTDKIKITLINNDIKDIYNKADELLLRPKNENVVIKLDSITFINNRFLKLE